MKHLIKIIPVVTCMVLLVCAPSCKKPKHPKDPCDNPRKVTALSVDYYSRGHFAYLDPDNSLFWLYATNISQYADKITPGQDYNISYKEVPCPDNSCGDKSTDGDNGFVRGGCMMPPVKCIMITCLQPVGNREDNSGCQQSLVDPDGYNNVYTQALSTSGIEGNSLNARIGYSGCDASNYKNFKLYLRPSPNGGPYNTVFDAKAVNIQGGVTCDAYFEKDICFDLSALKTYYNKNNMTVPEKITIRLSLRDGTLQELIYEPKY